MTTLVWCWVIAGWLLILILLTLAKKPTSRPTLILVEPLLTIFKDWHLARLTGGSQTEAARRIISHCRLNERPVDQILTPSKGKPPKARLLEERPLELMGKQIMVEENGKKLSYICGLLAETRSQLIATPAELAKLEQLEATAGERGFLALVVARTLIHAPTTPSLSSISHAVLGQVILEPVQDRSLLDHLGGQPVKLLSVLPESLVANLAAALSLPAGFAASSSLAADKFEHLTEKSGFIAGADFDIRYRAIRSLQANWRVRLFSRLPGDDRLPGGQYRPTL